MSDPSIVIQPESVSALRGDSVALSCGIVGTLLNFTWIKDNKILRDDDTWITFTRQIWQNIQIFSLNIKKVRSRYLGKYHCRVTNLQGSVSSKTAMVSYPGKYLLNFYLPAVADADLIHCLYFSYFCVFLV